MELTQNPSVLELVQKTAELTTPKEIVWIDGSEAQLESLRKIAVETGELIKLNEEKLPGCYLNRSDVNDVARVEGRTFICSRTREEAGPTNNWMDPDEMKAKLHEILRCAMAGRTMYVIPYSMGVIGSPFAKYGIEVTDSIYVVLNMAIMTRIGTKVLDALGDSSDVILGVHSKVTLDPENRYIVHFPEENKIISVNSNYGGNVLQGKKCFSLRIASVLGRREGWLAEHMLILGIQNPKGEVRYVTGAFPSACGKTNLAMLIPPEGYRKNGWKCWTVGDDIAWLRVGPDGRLWAVNPENGFFGVAPGTSERSNPNALASTSKNTIFTNVVLNHLLYEGLDIDSAMHDAYAWALIRSEHAFRLYTPAEELAISETICRPMLVGSVLSWVVFAALVALAVRVSAWFCIPAVLVCIYAAMCTCLGISYTVLIRTLRGECEDPVR